MKIHPKLRTLLVLILNFILLFALYQLLLRAESVVGMYLYLIAAAVLSVVYYVINRGFGKPITDPALLPEEWSYKEKCDYVDLVNSRHEKAKKLLFCLLPVSFMPKNPSNQNPRLAYNANKGAKQNGYTASFKILHK